MQSCYVPMLASYCVKTVNSQLLNQTGVKKFFLHSKKLDHPILISRLQRILQYVMTSKTVKR